MRIMASRREERGAVFNGYGISVWDDDNFLRIDSNDGCIM
jgi:hypothetical protein